MRMEASASPRPADVAAGDRVLLLEPTTGRRWLVHLDGGGARKEKGLGVFDPARLVALGYGATADVNGKRLVVLRPRLPDLTATVRRKAQIIVPKDLSRIVFELGLGLGDRVLESGIGSGAATLALATAVGPTGRVVVQELRDDFAAWALDNLRLAGLADGVTVHAGDMTQGLAEGVAEAAATDGPFHALLLDQPEPWLALGHAWPVLAPGARVACYCPQVGQMEQTVRRLRELGAADVVALELIERTWEVKERGARPSFEGLGHTGFLVFATRLA